ncbi:tyrosine-type recombinase/integrase [candidate division WWE3 bacterium]|uniref:Tyrosine-type recombinase/integrase n=1 Tax=candidate division WWE3 bacterium TaxID=2053526 RepID=A0A955LL85_UNCKA|nr:tyrosine-type recombinase/integrase [candidate division WWE3 bacterium]
MKIEKLKEKFSDYMNDSEYPESTVKGYLVDVDQFVDYLKLKGFKLVKEVELSDVQNYIEELHASNYAPRSIARKINALKVLFSYLENKKVIAEDFVKDIKHPKLVDALPRVLDDKELSRLREAVAEDEKYSAILETLLQTGMKIGELAKLKMEDVELVAGPKFGEVRVVEKEGERVIPINNAMEAVIENYIESRPNNSSDFVFVTRNGKKIPERNIRRKLQEYFKKAGITNVMVNDLRNTFVAHQLMKGMSIGRVAYLVGYKNLSSMNKFVKILEGKIHPEDEWTIEEV